MDTKIFKNEIHSIETEQEVQSTLKDLLEIAGYDPDFEDNFAMDEFKEVEVSTFFEAGILTNNKGLVLKLRNGKEFQLTIIQSK